MWHVDFSPCMCSKGVSVWLVGHFNPPTVLSLLHVLQFIKGWLRFNNENKMSFILHCLRFALPLHLEKKIR